jgi:hypothetical protein
MRIRTICTVVAVCALALLPLSGDRASAQSSGAEKPVRFTYVSEWTVPRAMWADYLKGDAADIEIMKKSVADGSIVAFGAFAVVNHQEGAPTHGTWFSANSMAAILKVLENVRTAPGATAPPLAAAKHWDYILESRDYNHKSGTFTNGYLRVGTWRTKGDAEQKVLRTTMVPMLEKLVADGALLSYQIDTESVHSSDPGLMFVAIVANGGEGIDKFEAGLDEMQKSNPGGYAGLSSTLDPAGHRDFLAHVSTMTEK